MDNGPYKQNERGNIGIDVDRYYPSNFFFILKK